MNINEIYQNYLQDIKLMQLATCKDGQPWLCSVWYVMDEDGNIYYTSREKRRHSQEIMENNKVACTFVKDFVQGLGEKGQALVISGSAEKLSGQDCVKPFELYNKENPKLSNMQSLEDFTNNVGPHYFFKITPTEKVWFDEQNFPDKPRQQIL